MSKKDDWGTRYCLLKVKQLKIMNMDVPNCYVSWKFNKETGTMWIRVRKDNTRTFGSSTQKICTAYRDYDDWM